MGGVKMLKTNSKKARENIRAYIMKNFRPEGYINWTLSEFYEIAFYILGIFQREYPTDKNMRNAFEHWAAGLPSVLNCDYYLNSAVDTLGDILEESPEERGKFTQEQAEKILTKLIYRELTSVE